MADHLHDRAGDRHGTGLGGVLGEEPDRAQGQDDVAHVVDGGVGDHPLEIRLGQGHERPVEHRDDADGHDHPGPRPPRLGQDRHGDAHEPVGAHLQQHPRQHGRAGGRGVRVGRGEPGVERHGGGLHGQAHQDRREHQPPGERLARQRRRGDELGDVEGVRVRGDVEPDEAQQQGQGAQERVEEELQRRPDRVAVAPPGDHEVHAHDGQVEEDEEQDEVGRHEHPEAHALQEQEQCGLHARAVRVPQGVDGAGQEHHGRHGQQRQGEPVHAHVVAAVDAGDPRHLLLERQAVGSRVLVTGPQHAHEQQLHDAHHHPRPPGGRGPDRRDHGQDGGGQQGQEDDQAQHAHPITA